MITKKIVKVKKAAVVKKKLTHFKCLVLSRHGSHSWLKDNIGLFPFRSIVRLGSTTSTAHVYQSRPSVIQSKVVECNIVQAVKNSANKKLMKICFTNAGVKTADWYTLRGNNTTQFRHENGNYNGNPSLSIKEINQLPYPIVAKHIYGSRGTGNYLLKTQQELESWLRNRANLGDYIFEKFENYTREYRLHVTKDGCFYTCRKMLREDTPTENRWYRNDSNCTWYMENNPGFNKPSNWATIEADCVKALKSLGGDIMGFDVKVQSEKDSKGRQRSEIKYIIIESGSACSHGEVTREKYLQVIPKVLKDKWVSMNQ